MGDGHFARACCGIAAVPLLDGLDVPPPRIREEREKVDTVS